MTTDQISLFALFLTLFGLLIWGRIRYDLVAFSALLVLSLIHISEPTRPY